MRKKSIPSPLPDKHVEVKFKNLPKAENDALPTIWVDVLAYMQRTDGLAMMKFYTMQPDRAIEQARMITSIAHVKRIIDTLARITNHYPVRSEEPKTQDTKS